MQDCDYDNEPRAQLSTGQSMELVSTTNTSVEELNSFSNYRHGRNSFLGYSTSQ